jgi:16S rRNA (adenine1518-N6/adenine1519-N6)-dimethyltransferase
LAESGFRFSKSLGQNFLISDNVLEDMIYGSGINEDTNVIEIGPGFGTLTQQLCQIAKKVVSVEIDDTVIPILTDNLKEFDNLKIINADILKTDIKKLIEDEFDKGPVKVVANLPYYITTPIIMALIEQELPIEMLVIMIQKEVADRIAAKPGTKDYGALGIAVNYYCETEVICNVPASCFIPQPKVSSSVIALKKRATPAVQVDDKKQFFKVVKAAFAQRRKTLLNALSAGGILGKDKQSISEILKKAGIDEKRRGETLSMEEFALVVKEISNHNI